MTSNIDTKIGFIQALSVQYESCRTPDKPKRTPLNQAISSFASMISNNEISSDTHPKVFQQIRKLSEDEQQYYASGIAGRICQFFSCIKNTLWHFTPMSDAAWGLHLTKDIPAAEQESGTASTGSSMEIDPVNDSLHLGERDEEGEEFFECLENETIPETDEDYFDCLEETTEENNTVPLSQFNNHTETNSSSKIGHFISPEESKLTPTQQMQYDLSRELTSNPQAAIILKLLTSNSKIDKWTKMDDSTYLLEAQKETSATSSDIPIGCLVVPKRLTIQFKKENGVQKILFPNKSERFTHATLLTNTRVTEIHVQEENAIIHTDSRVLPPAATSMERLIDTLEETMEWQP